MSVRFSFIFFYFDKRQRQFFAIFQTLVKRDKSKTNENIWDKKDRRKNKREKKHKSGLIQCLKWLHQQNIMYHVALITNWNTRVFSFFSTLLFAFAFRRIARNSTIRNNHNNKREKNESRQGKKRSKMLFEYLLLFIACDFRIVERCSVPFARAQNTQIERMKITHTIESKTSYRESQLSRSSDERKEKK